MNENEWEEPIQLPKTPVLSKIAIRRSEFCVGVGDGDMDRTAALASSDGILFGIRLARIHPEYAGAIFKEYETAFAGGMGLELLDGSIDEVLKHFPIEAVLE